MELKNNTTNDLGKHPESPVRTNPEKKEEQKIATITFFIEGMTCHSCAQKVEKALNGFTGVQTARVDFGRREAVIQYNPDEVSPEELKGAVRPLGYQLIQRQFSAREKRRIKNGRWKNLKPYLLGMAAGAAVIGFYLGLLTLTSDWYNARLEFKHFGPWILALAVGLGAQVSLFSFYRIWLHGDSPKSAKYSLAASGGLSTTAMAACCSHYLAILLPVLGLPFLSAGVAGLAEYQTYFFLIGVLSNIFGIGFMIRMMNKSGMIQFGVNEAPAH